MAMVRCQKHGRIWDNAREEACPLCLQEASMPRAPGRPSQAKSTSPDEAAAKGRQIMLLMFLVVVGIGGGIYWYMSQNTAADRAQAVRDSLRATVAVTMADTMKFANPSDLTPIRRARTLMAALQGILSANRAAVLGLPEGTIDSTGITDRRAKLRIRQQLTVVRRWHERLNSATRGGTDFRYAPNTRMGPQMESVTNYLGAAVSVMRDIVPPDTAAALVSVRSRADRVADFQAVTGYLNGAANVLTNMPR